MQRDFAAKCRRKYLAPPGSRQRIWRTPLRYSTIASAVLFLTAIWQTAHGTGLFAAGDPGVNPILLHVFIAVTSFTTLLVESRHYDAKQTAGSLASGQIGMTRWEIPHAGISDEDKQAHDRLLAERKPFRNFRCIRVTPDRRSRHISVTGMPLFDADRRFIGYRGLGREVTAEVVTEQRMARLRDFYAALSKVNNAIIHASERLPRHGRRGRQPSRLSLHCKDLHRPRSAGGTGACRHRASHRQALRRQ